jgi:hypothetical protein
VKKLLAHIEHVFALIAASRKARLSLGDNARVLLADYGSNPVDHRIALEILDGIYNIELPTQVTTRILDLGANIGTSAIYFQRRFPMRTSPAWNPRPATSRCWSAIAG